MTVPVPVTLDIYPLLDALGSHLESDVSDLPNAVAELVQLPFGLPDVRKEWFRIEGPTTLGTGELRFTLYPTDSLRELVTALRAGKLKLLVVKE